MSYDHERAFVTKVLETRDLGQALKKRITPEFLADIDTRDVYRWLIQQYQKIGYLPSRAMVREEFPEWRGYKTQDALPTIIDRVQDRKLYGDLQKSLKDIGTSARGSAREGLELLRKFSTQLSIRHSSTNDVDFTEAGDAIWDLYQDNKRSKGKHGVPYPWKTMTRMTRGKRRGQFICFYGLAETMKSWLLLKDADYTHRKHKKRVMLLTKEMTADECMERLAVLRAKISFDRYEDGSLSTAEERRFKKALDRLKKSPPFPIISIESTGQAALAEIRAKREEYGVDFVYIDGIYFLADDSEWGSFATITRGLKDIAKDCKSVDDGKPGIIVITTSQANAEGQSAASNVHGHQTDVSFGRTLFMDADMLVKIVRNPKHREDHEILLLSKKVRRGKPFKFVINAFPANDFTEKYSMDENVDLNSQGVDENAGGIV